VTFNAAVLTVSDSSAAGEREDTSGVFVREMLEAAGFEVTKYEIVPDSQTKVEKTLREWADGGEVGLIVTTGGTGLAPRDVTPEAKGSN
jgi:molybdenum cofactor synthesis domain-containing protein